MAVLEPALEIGRASDGAFDIGVGDAVDGLGLRPGCGQPGPHPRGAGRARRPAHEVLELDAAGCRVRKHSAADARSVGHRQGLRRGPAGRGGAQASASPPRWWRSTARCGRSGCGPTAALDRRRRDAPDHAARAPHSHPGAAGCRRGHLGRLPALGRGRRPALVAHHGPARAADRSRPRPPRSRSSPRPAWPPTPGRPR